MKEQDIERLHVGHVDTEDAEAGVEPVDVRRRRGQADADLLAAHEARCTASTRRLLREAIQRPRGTGEGAQGHVGRLARPTWRPTSPLPTRSVPRGRLGPERRGHAGGGVRGMLAERNADAAAPRIYPAAIVIRLRRESLFRADVAALERLARWLGLPEPRRWRTERERKAKIVEAIERCEKRLAKVEGAGSQVMTGGR
ncbi:hypothetical protein [Sorangium sp. So ce385]|uniref:hypothetical protein n=1 Tax=Sorangium sp. So ce385 TaxID=3133308 RepID=UPI003F5BE180